MPSTISKPAKSTTSQRQHLRTVGSPTGVDRENNVVRGVVLAELGPFKSAGRGEFTQESFNAILQLAADLPEAGLKSRFTHPGMSEDGLGKHLGRIKNMQQRGQKIRGDLHFDKTALTTSLNGGTPLGSYVMDLAESDPGALETSFVVSTDQIMRMNEDGTRQKGGDGKDLPPVWIPTKLHASDVVSEGDAVHGGFLSARNTSSWAEAATEYLDSMFPGADAEQFQSKVDSFLSNYLSRRFGADMSTNPTPVAELRETEGINDAIQKAIDAKLSAALDRIDKFTQLMQNQVDSQQNASRAETIASLCQQAGCADKASEFIANKELSVDRIREQLWTDVVSNRGMVADAPGAPGGGGEGSDPKSKLKALWNEGKEVYEKMGLTEEAFCESQGLESANPFVEIDLTHKALGQNQAFGAHNFVA